MSRGRLINEDIWKDDFIGSLSFFERLVWIGLLTCADDQGRMINNAIILRASVFPYDRNITDDRIAAALEKIAKAGKIAVYDDAGSRNLLQVVNWWRYQSPQWPQPSRYPPPPGWVDRVKRHGQGGKIETLNWDLMGGFQAECQASNLPSPLPSALPSSQPPPKDVEGEDEEEVDVEALHDDIPVLSSLSAAFVNATGIPELTGGVERWTQALRKMQEAGVLPEDISKAVQELRQKNYQIVGIVSIVNAAINVLSRRKTSGGGSLADQGYTYAGNV